MSERSRRKINESEMKEFSCAEHWTIWLVFRFLWQGETCARLNDCCELYEWMKVKLWLNLALSAYHNENHTSEQFKNNSNCVTPSSKSGDIWENWLRSSFIIIFVMAHLKVMKRSKIFLHFHYYNLWMIWKLRERESLRDEFGSGDKVLCLSCNFGCYQKIQKIMIEWWYCCDSSGQWDSLVGKDNKTPDKN